MTDDATWQAAWRLHDDFTHGLTDRRAFMGRLAALMGSPAAAATAAAAMAVNPAAAQVIAETDPRIRGDEVAYSGSEGARMAGYLVRPAGSGTCPAVLVLHENRGLTPYIRDVARRLGTAGFVALAPDLLAPTGGTPTDADAARDAIGALDMGAVGANAQASLAWLAAQDGVRGKPGTVGFCWGGALVIRLAVEAGPALGAGVAFYGPAPDPAEATRVRAPLMLHLAGLDDRVNGTARPWAEALSAADRTVVVHDYPGQHHAFHNDGAAGRYDAQAAALAWERSLAFLSRHLG